MSFPPLDEQSASIAVASQTSGVQIQAKLFPPKHSLQDNPTQNGSCCNILRFAMLYAMRWRLLRQVNRCCLYRRRHSKCECIATFATSGELSPPCSRCKPHAAIATVTGTSGLVQLKLVRQWKLDRQLKEVQRLRLVTLILLQTSLLRPKSCVDTTG